MLMFILPSGSTQHTHPKLPRLRGGGERDRDSGHLSLTPLSRSPHGTRAGGDSLQGSGGRISLSSLNRPPSRSRSRCRSRSVRRWVDTSAIRIVTCGSDSGGRTLPRRKRGATRGLRKSVGGGGGRERSALLGSHERNVRCGRASTCGAGLERELWTAGVPVPIPEPAVLGVALSGARGAPRQLWAPGREEPTGRYAGRVR
jgi:hypothetical protein